MGLKEIVDDCRSDPAFKCQQTLFSCSVLSTSGPFRVKLNYRTAFSSPQPTYASFVLPDPAVFTVSMTPNMNSMKVTHVYHEARVLKTRSTVPTRCIRGCSTTISQNWAICPWIDPDGVLCIRSPTSIRTLPSSLHLIKHDSFGPLDSRVW